MKAMEHRAVAIRNNTLILVDPSLMASKLVWLINMISAAVESNVKVIWIRGMLVYFLERQAVLCVNIIVVIFLCNNLRSRKIYSDFLSLVATCFGGQRLAVIRGYLMLSLQT